MQKKSGKEFKGPKDQSCLLGLCLLGPSPPVPWWGNEREFVLSEEKAGRTGIQHMELWWEEGILGNKVGSWLSHESGSGCC